MEMSDTVRREALAAVAAYRVAHGRAPAECLVLAGAGPPVGVCPRALWTFESLLPFGAITDEEGASYVVGFVPTTAGSP